MTKKQKSAALWGRMAAMPALLLSMLLAAPRTGYTAAEYNLYIGSTRVTSANAGNIFGETGTDGNPTAWYEADSQTLHLNGVHVDEDDYYPYGGLFDENFEDSGSGYGFYSMCSDTDVVKNLVVTGENTFKAEGTSTGEGGEVGIRFYIGKDTTFTITGDGTLYSEAYETRTDPKWERGIGMTIDTDTNPGEAPNSQVIIGGTDGTGPALYLTGTHVGLYAWDVGEFFMKAGTIVGQTTTPDVPEGTYIGGIYGVYLPEHNELQGGTIAGYSLFQPLCSSYNYYGDGDGEAEGEILYDSNPGGEPTWEVYGVDNAASQQVLSELGVTDAAAESDTGAGENGSNHTDIVPDPGTDIDVLGLTKAATVYSVDVAWGAMTFEYEQNSWDAENHTTIPGRGWLVYDNANDRIIDGKQDAINRITVTNHSNAKVYAMLSYTGNSNYTNITGTFTKKTDDMGTDLTEAAASTPAYLTLDTAENGKGAGGAGQETVGTIYFMPDSDPANDMSSWTSIGKITVGILTEQP